MGRRRGGNRGRGLEFLGKHLMRSGDFCWSSQGKGSNCSQKEEGQSKQHETFNLSVHHIKTVNQRVIVADWLSCPITSQTTRPPGLSFLTSWKLTSVFMSCLKYSEDSTFPVFCFLFFSNYRGTLLLDHTGICLLAFFPSSSYTYIIGWIKSKLPMPDFKAKNNSVHYNKTCTQHQE